MHRLQRLNRLHRLGHVANPVLRFADDLTGRGAWRRQRGFRPRRRGPSMVTLLLAGLAVLTLVKVMSVANGRRSTAEKVLLGGLIVLLAAVVLKFRRSFARYRA